MAHSEEFLAEQKQLLTDEQARLEAELARISRKNPDIKDDYEATFPDYGRDADENAQEEEVYEARLATEQALEIQLRDVRNALERIGHRSYGVCEKGGEPISEQRLRAFPSARTCVDHQ